MSCAVPQKCSGRFRIQLRVYLTLPVIALAAITGLCWLFFGVFMAVIPAAAAVAALVFMLAFPAMYCERMQYTRHRDWMKIERGILWKRVTLVPRRQMQYIRIKRGLIERILGISTLVIVTAGGRVALRGMPAEDALRMRELFERRALPRPEAVPERHGADKAPSSS